MTDLDLRLLRMIFERGAEGASLALSKWLGRAVRLSVSEVEQVELSEAAGVLGPPEDLVAACTMGLNGPLSGQILLVFRDRSGLALVDFLLGQPVGTTTSWGELEQSAAKETANIVGCAYVNALAAHLPTTVPGGELVPTPPTFLHEFAGSLLEFALMEQALEFDQVLLVHTAFEVTGQGSGSGTDPVLDWTLLFVPDRASLQVLAAALVALESPSS